MEPPSDTDIPDLPEGLSPQAAAAEFLELSTDVERHVVGWPRASSLYKACMRLHVLGTRSASEKKAYVDFKSKMIYGLGNAWHYWIQNSPEMFGDRRQGWWKCSACGRVLYFGGPPRKNCTNCGARKEAIVYREHTLKSKKLMVTGHPDLFLLRYPGTPLRVVELKSLSGDLYPKLIAPDIEHQWQIETYMMACSVDKNLPVETDREIGYIGYFSKKPIANDLGVKFFTHKTSRPLVNRIKAKLKTFRDGLKNYPEDLPQPVSACSNSNFTSYHAKMCPCKQECLTLLKEGK